MTYLLVYGFISKKLLFEMSTIAPFIGIRRHRLQSDGHGVTTLVGFHGCPLACRYCLNPQCHSPKPWKCLSPEELYGLVKVDNLYFLATGGGICFGGGEPCMYSSFIVRFRELCGKDWRITLETSLNVPTEQVEALLPVTDSWIIDVKDMNPSVYRAYTGMPNDRVSDNLRLLVDAKADCMVRVPLIPEYNTHEDVTRSVKAVRKMGFERINVFSYRKPTSII